MVHRECGAGCHAHGFAWACLPEAIATQGRLGQNVHGDDDLKLSREIWQDNPRPDGDEGSHAHAKPWAWHPAAKRGRKHRSIAPSGYTRIVRFA